jgi:hypothetical protein
MNYNLDTPQGMENAKQWVANVLARMNDNGVWVVPRTGTTVQFNKQAKTASVASFLPDPSIARVLREMGFSVTETLV